MSSLLADNEVLGAFKVALGLFAGMVALRFLKLLGLILPFYYPSGFIFF